MTLGHNRGAFPAAQVPQFMTSSTMKALAGVLTGLLVIASLALALAWLSMRQFDGPVGSIGIDLARPDALVRSHSLARLPADLLRVPLARDVLAEDFITYYEQHDDRLAIAGALRRIAYEHTLALPDRVLESVFDEPAALAFWRGGDGSLKYFALAMSRNVLARTLQLLLPLAGKDVQLSSAGILAGTQARIMVLEHGNRRKLLLISQGDRVVVLSDPAMLLLARTEERPERIDAQQDVGAAAVVARLLEGGTGDVSPFDEVFALGPQATGPVHEVLAGSGLLSFGYDRFAPALRALSFSFDAAGRWHSALLVDGSRGAAVALDGAGLWAALPHGASLCALLPVDWPALGGLATKFANASFAGHFDGPGAVCWYGDARLYTPLFIATLRAPADAALRDQFARLLIDTAGTRAAAPRRRGEGELTVWSAEVDSPYGEPTGGARRVLTTGLAISGARVMFSPDGRLVDKALDVLAKRYPSLADSSADPARQLAMLEPASLAALLRKEVFAALPRSEEAALRNAADAHLLPRLERLASYPPLRLMREATTVGALAWQPLRWDGDEAVR